MRKRARGEHSGQPCPAGAGIDRVQTGRERDGVAAFLECQRAIGAQERLDRSAEAGPELNLAGDGTLGDLACEARVEDEMLGQFHGLAHWSKVALCHLRANQNPPTR